MPPFCPLWTFPPGSVFLTAMVFPPSSVKDECTRYMHSTMLCSLPEDRRGPLFGNCVDTGDSYAPIVHQLSTYSFNREFAGDETGEEGITKISKVYRLLDQ